MRFSDAEAPQHRPRASTHSSATAAALVICPADKERPPENIFQKFPRKKLEMDF
jgi:hypothetical protein